ncbi:MAG: AAA family ATPase [Planctomycetes bacterium]|nr:AAA family ATPase [Planctomycetota bacterium]
MPAPQSPNSSSTPRPFAAATDPNRYFPATAIEEARQRIVRSIQRGEGPVLVIGAAGLGKTLLLEVVAQQFREQLRPVTLASGQLCTRRALLQMILFQLELPYRDRDESELRLSLLNFLQPQNAAGRRILLLVDEADSLPPRLLEELRAMTNLSSGGELQVNMVLAGNSALEEQFADPKLELFSQRVSARCYLSAFGREETFHYVRAQVAASGADPESLFTDDGLEAIFAATDGVPRLVNQLGDQLLWMVDQTGYSPLDGQIVQQAWSELQQLPAPWNTQSKEPLGGAVEFGDLPADEGDQEEIVFEDDSYDDDARDDYMVDFDDDLPASIPIHASQQYDEKAVEETPAVELSGIETIDVTEQLLEQLHVMEVAKSEAPVENDSAPIVEGASRNPFSETFDSEEIVLDRYSTFESLLLAEAPRVTNGTDCSFAGQLQQLEADEAPIADSQLGATRDTEEPSTTAFISEELGEVLIIEESEQPQTTLVEGQKFRQLFSSLESGDIEPCFG